LRSKEIIDAVDLVREFLDSWDRVSAALLVPKLET
jgi:hypothetical protein